MSPVLDIQDLSVVFHTPQGDLHALRKVSLTLEPGEILALVGESGCGKSVLCRAVCGLLPASASVGAERLTLDGVPLLPPEERRLRRLRGRVCALVLQNPAAALCPTLPVGRQIAGAVRLHAPRLSRGEVRRRVGELLEQVGVPRSRAGEFPCALSGGLCQRCALAIALAGEPKVLLADEPTTALDVTVQAQILDLLEELRRTLGTAVLLVTHDLGVAAQTADRVAVMYAGRVVETGTAEEIFADPRHPYTWGLLRSLPGRGGETLYSIPGSAPSPLHLPPGDAFACRNEYALAIDYEEEPPMFPVTKTHAAATWLLDPRAPRVTPPLGGALHD